MERFQQLMLKLEAGTATHADHAEIERLSDRLFGDGSSDAAADRAAHGAFSIAAPAASSTVLLSPKRERQSGSPAGSPRRERPPPGLAAPPLPHRPGSPGLSSPRSAATAGAAGSPRPVALHSQQRSAPAADRGSEASPFATQAVSPQGLRRSQILTLDASHARVHLSPRGAAEDRGALADRDLRRLLGGGRSPARSSPRSGSPGASTVRDRLARRQLEQKSEAAAKSLAQQRAAQREREQPAHEASPQPQPRHQGDVPSLLAAARSRTLEAVEGTPQRVYRAPEPEPEPEQAPLFPDTIVSQWGAYDRQCTPTAKQVRHPLCCV